MCGSGMPSSRLVILAALAISMLAAGSAAAQRAGKGEDESAAFVGEARAAMRKNKLDDAARSLDQAILLDPENIEAYVLRGAVHQSQKEFAAGVALLRRARAHWPTHPAVLARLGALLVKTPQGEREGLPLLEAAARRPSPRPEVLLALGELWRQRGEHRRAIVALRKYNLTLGSDASTDATTDASTDATINSTLALADSYLRARMPRAARDELAPLASRRAKAETPFARRQQQRLALLGALVEAAIDCAKASPRLAALDVSITLDILLVRGRCALELGDFDEAQKLARRYLASNPSSRTAGAVLLADVYAAQGSLIRARELLDDATVDLGAADKPDRPKLTEPQRRAARRTIDVRLAGLRRRGGELGLAIERLRAIGPPASPQDDARWWLELGKALLARDELVPLALAEFRAQLAAVLVDEIREPLEDELFEPRPSKLADPQLWALLGEIELELGDAAAAEKSLEHSLRLRPLRAVRELHARAAVQRRVEDAARKLLAGDGAGAEAELLTVIDYPGSRPNGALDGALAGAMWRNLGVARLMQQRGALAVDAFQRATQVAPGAINSMLLGRAFAMASDRVRARAAYEQAAKLASGAERLEVAIERAGFELSVDEPASAAAELDAVEDALPSVTSADASPERRALADRYRSARANARHVAGVEALRSGQAGRALLLLADGSRPEAPAALRCDYALAVLAARGGDAVRVLKNLGKAECPFAAQGDALKILTVAADSETPAHARTALASLQRLTPRPGASRGLWSAAVRVVAQNAAAEAFRLAQRASGDARAGYLAAAREHLRRARGAPASFGDDELELSGLALELDAALTLPDRRLADRRISTLLPALDRLAQRVPEAEVHLGLAYDHLQQGDLALSAWRRARRGGVRLPQLAEWIKAKERLEPKGKPGDEL